ncbi:unnamed protein product, partial [Staurois parvus]
ICHPGFSTRQVEGLQGKCLKRRKVAFHVPPLFVRSILGAGAWRFRSDLGGMKSPILGPGVGIGKETDCTGVCRPLDRVRTRVLGSTLADRSQEGSTPAVRRAPPRQTGVRRAPPRRGGSQKQQGAAR